MKRPQQGKFHLYGVSNDEPAWLSHLKKFSKPLQSRPTGPACRYGEAVGLFLAGLRWLKPARRPLSGLGKGAAGLSGIDGGGAGCACGKLRTTDLELLRPPTVV